MRQPQFFGYHGVAKTLYDRIRTLKIYVRRDADMHSAHEMGYLDAEGNLVLRKPGAVIRRRSLSGFHLDKIVNLQTALTENEYDDLTQALADHEAEIEGRAHNVRLQNWITVSRHTSQ